MREQRDLRCVLKDLESSVCLIERSTQRDGPVALEDERLTAEREGRRGLGDLVGCRATVRDGGNSPERLDGLGHHGMLKREPGDRERHCVRTMRVDDRPHIGANLVDGAMKPELRRSALSIHRPSAREVYEHDLRWL